MQRSSYHHGNLRNALLDTALQLMAQPGEHDITLRKLATRLGVSRSAPYRHFRNKSALMSAVAARGFSRMRNTFREEVESDDPEKAICEIMEDYVRFAVENPRLYRLMFSRAILESGNSEELIREAQMTFDRLGRILRKLDLGPGMTSEANVASWAMVHGISLLVIEGLLTLSSTGGISRTLIGTGSSATIEETRSHISSAAGILAAGIAASSPEKTT